MITRLIKVGLGILLSSLVGVWVWYSYNLKPASEQLTQPQLIQIPTGWNGRQIAAELARQGIIRNQTAFYFYLRQQGKANQLHAGTHWLSSSMSASEILEVLQKSQAQVTVTLLEGWRREEMAQQLGQIFGQAGDSRFDQSEFLRLTQKLEGRLFPETYSFSPQASAAAVVQTLTDEFKQRWQQLPRHPVLTDDEVLILASLVEREANNATDRRGIANVLFTRLQADWPLQVDATLQYIKANKLCINQFECDWWPSVGKLDKQWKSPYNTYLYFGLPPAPIANPGWDSLLAAAEAERSQYWFYLTDYQGITHFSVTYEEHLAKINRYLR